MYTRNELRAAARAAVEDEKRHPNTTELDRVDWVATENYWADPRCQEPDAFGRHDIDRRVKVMFPRAGH